MGIALANEAARPKLTRREVVLCQWQQGREQVFQKTQVAGEKCYLEKIETSVGEVLIRRGIACESPCNVGR